jgi:hypothetical protein
MEMQGHEVVDDLHQGHILEHAMDLPDHAEHIQPEELVPAEEGAEVLMNISSAAHKGCPSDSTISLTLHIGHTTTIALAGTGSTNTFMGKAFALKHNICITATA